MSTKSPRTFAREFKLDLCRQIQSGQKRPAQLCREHQLAEGLLLRWRGKMKCRGGWPCLLAQGRPNGAHYTTISIRYNRGMRAIIQRAARAAVTLKESGERREIGPGLVTLLGVAPGDTPADAEWLAEKLAGLRVFEDGEGKMNLSLLETGGAMLVVSQFTLLGDARKGRRPSFTGAAPPDVAEPLYEVFVRAVQRLGVAVKTGEFGADMLVEVANDGPVTLIVETPERSA